MRLSVTFMFSDFVYYLRRNFTYTNILIALLSLISALLLFQVVSGSQHGADGLQRGLYYTYGVGRHLSCPEWVEKDEAGYAHSGVYANWMLGFLSGVGYAGVDIKHTDYDQKIDWLTKYCKENPLDDYYTAVTALIRELL